MKIIYKTSAAFSLSVLVACGGGGGGVSTETTTAITASYPEGVSASSPTAVAASSSTTITASVNIPPNQKFANWVDTLVAAVINHNSAQFIHTLQAALPFGDAIAAPTKVPEGKLISAYISEIASGTKIPTVTNMGFESFFKSYVKADCFGPSVAYTLHDDFVSGANQNGTLPTGDLGMWLARESNQTTGRPCSAAQLDSLINPIKQRTNASMMLSARMRALAISAGGLPASGATVDVTSGMDTLYQSLLPTTPVATTGSVSSATVSNAGGVYTYTFTALAAGGGRDKKIVIQMIHDGTATNYSGRLTYATTGGDSCTQANGGASGVKTSVGTVRYLRISSSETQLSARSSNVCVAGTRTNVTNTFSDYVALTSNNEIDPAVTETSNVKGWTQEGSGFNRYAATYNPSTLVGNYKFAWQAGINDDKSRMFTMVVQRDSTTEDLSAKAFFGYSGSMTDTSTGAGNLKGMICNWAGPGNSHTPGNNFQFQSIKLSSTASDWDFATGTGTNKITYAPTVSCTSSATMKFDVNADGTLGATEGNSITTDLDVVDPTKSVQETIEARGFVNPALY
jgi:hypothetical protein